MTGIFMVQRAHHNHNYDLRNEGDLRVPYARTVAFVHESCVLIVFQFFICLCVYFIK